MYDLGVSGFFPGGVGVGVNYTNIGSGFPDFGGYSYSGNFLSSVPFRVNSILDNFLASTEHGPYGYPGYGGVTFDPRMFYGGSQYPGGIGIGGNFGIGNSGRIGFGANIPWQTVANVARNWFGSAGGRPSTNQGTPAAQSPFTFLPDGTKMLKNPDGTTFWQSPDGSTVYQYANGSTQWKYSDGSTVYKDNDGNIWRNNSDGSSVFQYPNGNTNWYGSDGSSVLQNVSDPRFATGTLWNNTDGTSIFQDSNGSVTQFGTNSQEQQ